MFSGIVEETGRVLGWQGSTLRIQAAKTLEGAGVGSSIAVNGACLTITSMQGKTFTVDVVPETARRTNLGQLGPGALVDLERPMAYGGPVGGHLVQGHVDAVGRVVSITPEGNSHIFRLRVPRRLMRYIVEKGFVAVDGVSLTVVKCGAAWFTVSVIPYTYRNTVFGALKPSDPVNLEVDILAKYVEGLLKGQRRPRSG